jgi:hypothetical protein
MVTVASTKFIDGVPRKPATKYIHRIVVKLQRCVALLQDAVAHHGDALPHRHGFDLVVRHINRRHFEATMQLDDFGARLHAQFGIQVGKRLIHQEHFGVSHNGAPNATRWR